MKRFTVMVWALASLAWGTNYARGAVERVQTISFAKGWNSVYVEVAPGMTADELFADWPVDAVALYDPAAFLDTRQYFAEDSTEGTARNVMRMWRRNNPGANEFSSVSADVVLVFKATGAGTRAICGEPCAPRIAWHLSSATEPKNYVGLSTWAPTTLAAYFSGVAVDVASCTRPYGTGDVPEQGAVFPSMMLDNGTALAVDATKICDWSGVIHVSPRDGIDFGVAGSQASLEIRNDGATRRTVQLGMIPGAQNSSDSPVVPGGLYMRDELSAVTNGPWTAFSTTTTNRMVLAPGETWKIKFALDRLRLNGPSGTVFGALLDVRDIDGGSMMRVTVPLAAMSDGGASSQYAWPKGVWLMSAEFDQVSFFLTKKDDSAGATESFGMKPSGGKMKVRLPFYVDEAGRMTLLQRFWYGRNTNGVLRAFSGAVEASDEPLVDIKRVSSAFLPADQPQIALGEVNYDCYTVPVTNVVDVTNEVGEVVGAETNVTDEVRSRPVSTNVFGDYARAEFTVDETSNVNPMRHAPHPRHDGLTADYLGATPSGDDLSNYSGTVKPEAFSITNRIEFTWNKGGATTWNPAETLSGIIKWELGGIRHEGPIHAQGRFSMKRLSPVTMKLKE